MATRIFPTAQDAEAAFYEALERADLELMMAVWSEDEDIVCVHRGPRLAGRTRRASWRQILSGGTRARRIASGDDSRPDGGGAQRAGENFSVPGETRPMPAVVATNVYLRTAAGWRMIVHHGSPAPGSAEPTARDVPKILH
jgi:ketosteroid isomerase-like protein